jgi:hypothetical protein
MFATFAFIVAAAHDAAIRLADLECQYIALHGLRDAFRETVAARAGDEDSDGLDYEYEDVCYNDPMADLQRELIVARRENAACQRALILAERREERAERKEYRAEHRRAA